MREKICYAIVCCVTACSVFCGAAKAEEYKHDGFFLRVAPGLGVMNSSEKFGATKYEYNGTSGLFNLAIGAAIFDNFIIHLDLSAASMSEPRLKINGRTADNTTTDYATSVLGIGVTYYFPSNLYLTGAVGTASSELKENGKTYRTDDGYGINLMLGKEWWVSKNWGLGVAGQWLYTNCPDKPYAGTTPDVITSSVGILFSATYN